MHISRVFIIALSKLLGIVKGPSCAEAYIPYCCNYSGTTSPIFLSVAETEVTCRYLFGIQIGECAEISGTSGNKPNWVLEWNYSCGLNAAIGSAKIDSYCTFVSSP